jgi:multiple sugar transport system ATP-binding protein
VMEPDVLLMDEPLSNLDALLRLQFRAELKKLLADLGTTCLYVTHDQVEALSLGERIAVMDEGEIVQSGDPLAVYEAPASVFVGGFLGSPPMNFLAATVRDGTVHLEGRTLPAPPHWPAGTSGPVLVGVRAETITAYHPGDEPDGALPAVAEVVEPLGSTTLVTALLGDQRLKVQVPPGFTLDAGDRIWLAARPERLGCYDRSTGRALL